MKQKLMVNLGASSGGGGGSSGGKKTYLVYSAYQFYFYWITDKTITSVTELAQDMIDKGFNTTTKCIPVISVEERQASTPPSYTTYFKVYAKSSTLLYGYQRKTSFNIVDGAISISTSDTGGNTTFSSCTITEL